MGIAAPTVPDSAWRDLPPLRPSAPAIELTAPVQRLSATMTSTQRPGVTQDELGHARSADGPAGTVVGLLKPRAAMHRERADGGALVYAAAAPEPVAGASAVPLRRGPTGPAATPNHGQFPDAQPVGSTLGADARTPDLPPVPTLSAPASRPTVASSPSPAPSPSGISGAQRMPAAVSDLPAIAARPLQARERAAPVTTPRDPVSMPVAVPDPSPIQAPSTPSTNFSTTTGTPATIPSNIASILSPPSSGSSLGADPPPSIERSPLVGRTRIVRRIGEPLRERPASMVPTADAPVSTLAQPQPASQTGIARLPQPVVAGSRPWLPAPGAVPDRVARAVASIDAPSSGPSATVDVDGGADGRPEPARPRPARPLVGSRPSIQRLAEAPTGSPLTSKLSGKPPGTGVPNDPEPVPVRWGPSVQTGVQRAPEGVPADLRAELEPVLGTPLADVKVHRDDETGEAARQLSAKAFTAGGEVFLPEWHGSTSGGEARTILTHELTHVAQQRRLGSALPDEASSEGTALESEARAVAQQGPPVAARPVASSRAAGAPQRLAGEAPSPPVRTLAARSGSGMTPSDVAAQVQAAASAAGLAPSPPTVDDHRPDEPGSSPTVAPPATGSSGGGGPNVVQRLPDAGDRGPAMTTSVSTPETPTDDPAQLDELARRLYPRFRTRLRQDLLADRERSGRLFDVR